MRAGECVPGVGEPLCSGVDTDCDGVVDNCAAIDFLPGIGKSGIGDGELPLAEGVALDSSGVVHVAARYHVQSFSADGVFQSFFSSPGGEPIEFSRAVDLDFDAETSTSSTMRREPSTSLPRPASFWRRGTGPARQEFSRDR